MVCDERSSHRHTDDAHEQLLIADGEKEAGAEILGRRRNQELFMWCVTNGLRIVIPMTHMSLGLYNEPQGAFLPGVLY